MSFPSKAARFDQPEQVGALTEDALVALLVGAATGLGTIGLIWIAIIVRSALAGWL